MSYSMAFTKQAVLESLQGGPDTLAGLRAWLSVDGFDPIDVAWAVKALRDEGKVEAFGLTRPGARKEETCWRIAKAKENPWFKRKSQGSSLEVMAAKKKKGRKLAEARRAVGAWKALPFHDDEGEPLPRGFSVRRIDWQKKDWVSRMGEGQTTERLTFFLDVLPAIFGVPAPMTVVYETTRGQLSRPYSSRLIGHKELDAKVGKKEGYAMADALIDSLPYTILSPLAKDLQMVEGKLYGIMYDRQGKLYRRKRRADRVRGKEMLQAGASLDEIKEALGTDAHHWAAKKEKKRKRKAHGVARQPEVTRLRALHESRRKVREARKTPGAQQVRLNTRLRRSRARCNPRPKGKKARPISKARRKGGRLEKAGWRYHGGSHWTLYSRTPYYYGARLDADGFTLWRRRQGAAADVPEEIGSGLSANEVLETVVLAETVGAFGNPKKRRLVRHQDPPPAPWFPREDPPQDGTDATQWAWLPEEPDVKGPFSLKRRFREWVRRGHKPQSPVYFLDLLPLRPGKKKGARGGMFRLSRVYKVDYRYGAGRGMVPYTKQQTIDHYKTAQEAVDEARADYALRSFGVHGNPGGY